VKERQQVPFVVNPNLSVEISVSEQEMTKPFDALAIFRQALDMGCTPTEIVAAFAEIGLHFDGLPDPAAAQALDEIRMGWPASIPTKEQRAAENFRASAIADAISGAGEVS